MTDPLSFQHPSTSADRAKGMEEPMNQKVRISIGGLFLNQTLTTEQFRRGSNYPGMWLKDLHADLPTGRPVFLGLCGSSMFWESV